MLLLFFQKWIEWGANRMLTILCDEFNYWNGTDFLTYMTQLQHFLLISCDRNPERTLKNDMWYIEKGRLPTSSKKKKKTHTLYENNDALDSGIFCETILPNQVRVWTVGSYLINTCVYNPGNNKWKPEKRQRYSHLTPKSIIWALQIKKNTTWFCQIFGFRVTLSHVIV